MLLTDQISFLKGFQFPKIVSGLRVPLSWMLFSSIKRVNRLINKGTLHFKYLFKSYCREKLTFSKLSFSKFKHLSRGQFLGALTHSGIIEF